MARSNYGYVVQSLLVKNYARIGDVDKPLNIEIRCKWEIGQASVSAIL